MKNIAVLFNTDELGGAERSLIWQLKDKKDCKMTFFVPRLSCQSRLVDFLKSSSDHEIRRYHYPLSLYSLSRKNLGLGPKTITELARFCLFSGDFSGLNEFDLVYINGNKAAFLFFIKDRLLKYKGKVIWHWRDYFQSGTMLKWIWKCISRNKLNLNIVCNSFSVKEGLALSPWAHCPVEVIYNPVGEEIRAPLSKEHIKVIGFVAMLAPWKGLHEIILWSKLYEKELHALGIEKIKIFGESIYKTTGVHTGYAEQIKDLCNKLGAELISFEGMKSPEVIYNEIDCLIHNSLTPEPFGRVIIEALCAGVPVISTCLGGAAELIQDPMNGIKVYPHDRRGLFQAVEQLIKNKESRSNIIFQGKLKAIEIQKNISRQMDSILDLNEVS